MKNDLVSIMAYCKQLGADYADIRFKDISEERVTMEDGQVTDISNDRSRGFGIRVYADGSMGFSASSNMESLKETAERAYQTARASRVLQKERITLSAKTPAEGSYSTPVSIDPFTVPLAEKLTLLTRCHKAMSAVDGITKTECGMAFRKEEVIFADTDGSYIEQHFCQSSGAITARAVSETDTQDRSYGNYLRGGYEAVLGLKLDEHAPRAAEECVRLINAPECPGGVYDLILTPRQLFLQIHESVGHPTELDRVFGSEAAFAGMSFVTADYLTAPLRYGSDHVTIAADAHSPMGLGTFGYDDEGTPAQRVTLVDKGMFRNYLTSRDNASKIGQASHGMGLSDGWQNIPIVRMTNISLLPGEYEMDELIAGISYGFILDENKSWSIDDKRINFQFACEIAYEIKDGQKTGRIFKNPIYTGKTTAFWGSCDGVCGEKYWQLVGVPNCGKGQPMQIMRVAHGSSPARFRNVQVGVGAGQQEDNQKGNVPA